jgi:hypothetical protein
VPNEPFFGIDPLVAPLEPTGLAIWDQPAGYILYAILQPHDSVLGQVSANTQGSSICTTDIFSFAAIAGIMCLLSHPDKPPLAAQSSLTNPDRNLPWCLDLLQAHCEGRHPEGSSSYTLGTYGDAWMHLRFTLHTFTSLRDPEPEGSGMLLGRRTVAIPRIGTVVASHLSVVVRAAKGLKATDYATSPAVVVVLSRRSHMRIMLSEWEWPERGLVAPPGAEGVALFQALVWDQIEEWAEHWEHCIGHMHTNIDDRDLSSPLPRGETPRSRAEVVSERLKCLEIFRDEISVTPRALKQMYQEWERKCKDHTSDWPDRFDKDTQVAVLENWVKLQSHMSFTYNRIQGSLREKETELRNIV